MSKSEGFSIKNRNGGSKSKNKKNTKTEETRRNKIENLPDGTVEITEYEEDVKISEKEEKEGEKEGEKEKNKKEQKRSLSSSEISSILDFIKPLSGLPFETAQSVYLGQIQNHEKQLSEVKIYPSKIPELKKILEKNYFKALAEPGKSVGALASSSIGEKNTQSSLSSFHQAGQQKVALTTGVPRLEELINVSKEIKTPSMEIYLDMPLSDLKNLKKVKEVAQSILEYKEMEYFILDYEIKEDRVNILTDEEEKWYDFHRLVHNSDFEECNWSIRLYLNISALFSGKQTLSKIAKIIEKAYCDSFCVCSPDNIGIIDVFVQTDKLGSVEDIINMVKSNSTKKSGKSSSKGEDVNLFITDENKEFYFIRDLVVPSILHLQITGIDGIKKCYFNESSDGTWSISTKGSNLKAILGHPLVNRKKTTSNHLWDIFECFGIEGTRQFLYEEMSRLIGVNRVHFSLLIDSMTYTGVPMACTRYGMNRNHVGVLAQVAFEQSFENFFSAAVSADSEDCSGVSAAIILGKYPKLGSHFCDMIDVKTGKILNEEQLTYNFEKNLQINNSRQIQEAKMKTQVQSRVQSQAQDQAQAQSPSHNQAQSRPLTLAGVKPTLVKHKLYSKPTSTEKIEMGRLIGASSSVFKNEKIDENIKPCREEKKDTSDEEDEYIF